MSSDIWKLPPLLPNVLDMVPTHTSSHRLFTITEMATPECFALEREDRFRYQKSRASPVWNLILSKPVHRAFCAAAGHKPLYMHPYVLAGLLTGTLNDQALAVEGQLCNNRCNRYCGRSIMQYSALKELEGH